MGKRRKSSWFFEKSTNSLGPPNVESGTEPSLGVWAYISLRVNDWRYVPAYNFNNDLSDMTVDTNLTISQ